MTAQSPPKSILSKASPMSVGLVLTVVATGVVMTRSVTSFETSVNTQLSTIVSRVDRLEVNLDSTLTAQTQVLAKVETALQVLSLKDSTLRADLNELKAETASRLRDFEERLRALETKK